ncbi:MAG: hypothetical protein AB4290_01910 [Spirulina sp.]
MTTTEKIQEKLKRLTEEQRDRVYAMIEQLSNSEDIPRQPSVMEKLREIKIDAPEDFSIQVATNLGRGLDEE